MSEPIFRTQSGQTGVDAYLFEFAQIANAERDLRERRLRLALTISREMPNGTVQPPGDPGRAGIAGLTNVLIPSGLTRHETHYTLDLLRTLKP